MIRAYFSFQPLYIQLQRSKSVQLDDPESCVETFVRVPIGMGLDERSKSVDLSAEVRFKLNAVMRRETILGCIKTSAANPSSQETKYKRTAK